MTAVAIGIDLATADARVVAADDRGAVLAEQSAALAPPVRDGERSEQDAAYWPVVARLLASTCRALGPRAKDVRALCVTGTSGTIVPCDEHGVPRGRAVLYDDTRAGAEADRLRAVPFAATPTSPVARLGWLAAHSPSPLYLHTCDVVVAALLGAVAPTDTSHALKAGVDPLKARWDTDLLGLVDVPRRSLPDLVHPGTVLGTLDGPVSAELGLPDDAVVVAGMTDGCTGQIASGAVTVGDTVGVLGTTLVVKGVSPEPVTGVDGAVYSHYAPDGRFWPGGASNVGAGLLRTEFPGAALSDLDRAAGRHVAASAVRYPLPGRGERFPFTAPDAVGFTVGDVPDRTTAYRVLLEGVAFTERLGLETLARLGVPSRTHRVAGGSSVSATWNRIRASVLDRTLLRPGRPTSALGAAVLAFSGCTGEPLSDLTARMVRIEEEIEPDPTDAARLDEGYRTLLEQLRLRGLLPDRDDAHAGRVTTSTRRLT